MHKYTQDSQKSAYNCTSDSSEQCVGNLLFDTGMLKVCQGPLNASGHPAHTWPYRGTLTLPFCLLVTLCKQVIHCHLLANCDPRVSELTETKALIKMPPDTRLIREESYLNLQHHLKSDGKSSTPKSCKDATDSPSLFPSPKIHQHLDRTSGFLLRRAASRHRNLVRTAAHKRVSCPHHNTQQKLWHSTSTQA